MQNYLNSPKLILASQSPRRNYLLKQAGLTFTVIPSDLDEDAIPHTEPENYVRILAEAKAGDIADRHPDCWVLGADTIVLIDNTILGKPSSRSEARSMLQQLSGQTHRVLTGYAILNRDRKHQFSETVATDVTFKQLTDEEIEWYIHTREPFDKAGAYAIQGLGTFLVKTIHGSYTNVVGLPVCEVIEHLIRHEAVTRENSQKTKQSATEEDGH